VQPPYQLSLSSGFLLACLVVFAPDSFPNNGMPLPIRPCLGPVECSDSRRVGTCASAHRIQNWLLPDVVCAWPVCAGLPLLILACPLPDPILLVSHSLLSLSLFPSLPPSFLPSPFPLFSSPLSHALQIRDTMDQIFKVSPWVSRIYMYLFVLFFITVVLNIFIQIIQEGYYIASTHCHDENPAEYDALSDEVFEHILKDMSSSNPPQQPKVADAGDSGGGGGGGESGSGGDGASPPPADSRGSDELRVPLLAGADPHRHGSSAQSSTELPTTPAVATAPGTPTRLVPGALSINTPNGDGYAPPLLFPSTHRGPAGVAGAAMASSMTASSSASDLRTMGPAGAAGAAGRRPATGGLDRGRSRYGRRRKTCIGHLLCAGRWRGEGRRG